MPSLADVSYSEPLLVNTAADISYTSVDQYGEPTTPAGTVTVQISDSAGTDVYAAGTATTLATNVSTKALAVTDVTAPDQLTAVWTDDGNVVATTLHDIVGAQYYSIEALRAATSLSDATANPDAALREDRWEIGTQIESVCNQAFVPRFASEIVESHGGSTLYLRWMTVNTVVWANYWNGSAWTAVTGTLADIPESVVGEAELQDAFWPSGRIQIGYRHGMANPPPDLRNAAIQAAENHRTQDTSGVHKRAISIPSDAGTLQLATPGMFGWVTADPVVDEVLKRPGYKRTRLAIY